ncbi:MAG: ABC transporter permease subunit [Dehalococcoidia bacterium]|nr:ABC transporter permease subunit [Dehalococcoidia bacterium]
MQGINRKVSTKIWQTLLALVVFVLIWWFLSALMGAKFLPSPLQTVEAFFRRLSAPYGMNHVWDSFYRVIVGTSLGAIIGIVFGVASHYIKVVGVAVRSVIFPLLQSVPTICWALIFVLWLGFNGAPPILSIIVASAPFFIINTWEGMKELDTNLVEMASSYTRRSLKILRKIVMPMLYPYIFAASKSGFMIAWKVIIPAEIFGAHSGMGYMVHLAYGAFNIDDVFGWALAFAAILIFFDYGVFNFIDRKFVRKWKPLELKRS